MLSLKIDEAASFEFNMSVDGSSVAPEVLFVINEGKRKLAFEATHLGEGKYQVNLPALRGQLSPGVHSTQVWVTMEDKIFKPLSEDLEIKEEVKAVIKGGLKESAPTSAPSVEVAPTVSGFTKISQEDAALVDMMLGAKK